MKKFLVLAALVTFFVYSGLAPRALAQAPEPITIAYLTAKYHGGLSGQASFTPSAKIRILIVPGHQPSAGGTEFGPVKERDIVVGIADKLAALLAKDPHYDVMVARTKTAWNPILQTYFDTHAADIVAFRQSQALQMAAGLVSGSLKLEEDQVHHNTTSSLGALQLYGINKWSNENAYDITLHLHINDDTEHRPAQAGKYSGFAVYVPDRQYANAAASKAIGESIAARLTAYHATSTLPIEDRGVVEDQGLIATGSNNSANDAALLIEYGYIYEPQFRIASARELAVADYAYQTYLGLRDFFDDPVVRTHGSLAFPYDWTAVTAKKGMKGKGVYALQAALHALGYYPSAGSSFGDCPISGVSGACTRSAISAYQREHGLAQSGYLGPKTRAALKRDLKLL